MAENMNTGDAAVVLPKEVSDEIWQDAQEASAVMRFANKIDLPGVGLSVPMITGDPTAEWAGETDEIVVGDSTLDNREMKGHKIGVIETFSKEFRRDAGRLYEALRERLPGTIASKFDATVFHALSGTGPVNMTTFDSFRKSGVQSQVLTSATAYDDLVAIDEKVSLENGALSAYVLSPRARGVLLRAKDVDERPLLVNNVQTDGAVTALLGVDAFRSGAVYAKGAEDDAAGSTLGFAGDFRSAFYGVVQDIEIEVSDQATITKNGQPLNLWQRDMFAVKVTAHLGFMIRKGHEGRFVRITDGVVVNELP
jgi:HK97 family phage major capsid protein